MKQSKNFHNDGQFIMSLCNKIIRFIFEQNLKEKI